MLTEELFSHTSFGTMSHQNRYARLQDEDDPKATPPTTPPKRGKASVPHFKQPWRTLGREKRPKRDLQIPTAVLKQIELRKRHKYVYRVVNNGNVENNCTLYVNTGVAHAYQIEGIFQEVIERAKTMPEIFGSDFECDAKVNVVRRHSGEYMAYAFVDLTDPKLYYALIGCNVDGTERAEYIEDPNWTPPSTSPPVSTGGWVPGKSWADDDDEPIVIVPPQAPKIRRELPPLITLAGYNYDKQQMEHLQTKETQGMVTVSPAFITPGVNEEYDDCSLYVSRVPQIDYDFLYEIFARYSRSSSPDEDGAHFFPKIKIQKSSKEGSGTGDDSLYAIVQYSHPYDAHYALQMLQKIRARYNGADITMPVRHAFSNRRKK